MTLPTRPLRLPRRFRRFLSALVMLAAATAFVAQPATASLAQSAMACHHGPDHGPAFLAESHHHTDCGHSAQDCRVMAGCVVVSAAQAGTAPAWAVVGAPAERPLIDPVPLLLLPGTGPPTPPPNS